MRHRGELLHIIEDLLEIEWLVGRLELVESDDEMAAALDHVECRVRRLRYRMRRYRLLAQVESEKVKSTPGRERAEPSKGK